MSGVEITVFRKSGGALTKRIPLAADGSVKSDGSQCIMPHGWAQRFAFDRMWQFAELIKNFSNDQAFATGSLRPGLPDKVEVVTKSKLNGSQNPGIIARTQDYLIHRAGERTIELLDFDAKGMPPAVTAKLEDCGGVWRAYEAAVPKLGKAARVERASTSAGIYDERTGEKFLLLGGRHIYVLIKDGADSERFLKTLHRRCWLAGFGWMIAGAGGQLLERSIVDRVCSAPERLVFAGPPVLDPPLAQDLAERYPVVVEGEPLDTVAACPPLTVVELARFRELWAKEAHRLAGECAKAREDFINRQSRRLAERDGMDLQRVRGVIERQCAGVLFPYVDLPFDDPELAGKTVADVLADPTRFEGETLADPIEGVEYGSCKAKIMRRADGSVLIHSFAHGGATYELKVDFFSAKAELEKAAKADVADLLVRLVLSADLDDDEIEDLRNIACEKTGITKRAMGRKIKNALMEAAARRARAERHRRLAERRDPRPQLPVALPDAEYIPQMKTLNEVIRADKSAEPATRNPNKVLALDRRIRVPSLHALTTTEINVDDDPTISPASPRATDTEAAE